MPETLDLSQGITDSQLHTEQLANTSIVRITNAQQIIDKFASQNDFSSGSINTFCASLKETLGASLNDQFVQYNDDFQKWSKHIEKKFKTDSLTSLFSPTLSDASSDSGLSCSPYSEQKKSCINYAIAEYFYRKGLTELADCFCQEIGLLEEETQLHTKFANLNQILQQLYQFNIEAALNWCGDNKEVSENIVFLLNKLVFIKRYNECVALQDASEQGRLIVELVQFAKTVFSSYSTNPLYKATIQKLMTSILWLRQRNNKNIRPTSQHPYALLTNLDQVQQEAIREFTHIYCLRNGMTEYSPLEIVVNAGSITIPKVSKIMALIRDKKVEWTQTNELPVEIELPAEYQNFHSVFTCPVLKVQGSEENPPMCLPCGHVICKDALIRLSKGQAHLKFKCPYCPTESTSTEAVVVHL